MPCHDSRGTSLPADSRPDQHPDRVLRAMAAPTIDHRSAEFAALGREILDGLKPIFQTRSPVVIYPASGSGAWEASLVNTLSPGRPRAGL